MRLGQFRGRLIAGAIAVAVLVAGCGTAGPTLAPGTLPVMTTMTVFADLVRQVGGTHVSVTSLVPNGGDVHTFEPQPADVQRLSKARLAFMNGLGLDDWLQEMIGAGGSSDLTVVKLGEDLAGVDYLTGEDGTINPHLWMDVAYARLYVARIRDALIAADPANAAAYRANAASYDAQLATLDDWARSQIGAIPAADRKIVSFHDAFPYFAKAYGLTVAGTVVASPGQDPSAGNVAKLIAIIKREDVKAIFTEIQFNPKIVETIASETGATVEGNLYSDTLGDPPADSYIGIIRWDVDHVVKALTTAPG